MKAAQTFLNRAKYIKNQVRKNKSVIYGARSMNQQIHGFLGRITFDYDIYSKRPKKSARQLEKILDFHSGKNIYYSAPSKFHKGTHKVYHIGKDMKKGTDDDFALVDFSKTPIGLKVIKRNGLIYSHLSNTIKDKKSALSDPLFKFRWEKDQRDLDLINTSKRLSRWKW